MPGNAVWRRRVLTREVDWSSGRIGPRAYDLPYCRADVALLAGYRAADRLARHCADLSGGVPAGLAYVDPVRALQAHRFGVRSLTAYREQGRQGTARQFAARLTPFLRRALAVAEVTGGGGLTLRRGQLEGPPDRAPDFLGRIPLFECLGDGALPQLR